LISPSHVNRHSAHFRVLMCSISLFRIVFFLFREPCLFWSAISSRQRHGICICRNTVTSPQQTNKQHHYSCASKALLHSFVLDQENAEFRAKQRNSIQTSKGLLRYPSDMTRRAAVRLARFVFSPERKSVFLTFRPGLFFFASSARTQPHSTHTLSCCINRAKSIVHLLK